MEGANIRAITGLLAVLTVLIIATLGTWTYVGSARPPDGVHLSENGQEIIVSGRFIDGMEKRFRRVLDNAPNARVVRLFSAGGYVNVARRIRSDVRERRLDTVVSGLCASACTFVFLAGERRVVEPGGRLGFHSFSVGGRENDFTDRELQLTYGYHWVPQDFVNRVALTPATAVWYPRADELLNAHIITEIRAPKRGWWQFWR